MLYNIPKPRTVRCRFRNLARIPQREQYVGVYYAMPGQSRTLKVWDPEWIEYIPETK